MKKLLSLALLLCSFLASNAQANFSQEEKGSGNTTVTSTSATAPAKKVVYVDGTNKMNLIEMSVADGWASFHNLDGIDALRLYITNSNGDIEIDRKVSSRSNAVEIGRLKAGLYFVSLVNENNGQRKSFTLNK